MEGSSNEELKIANALNEWRTEDSVKALLVESMPFGDKYLSDSKIVALHPDSGYHRLKVTPEYAQAVQQCKMKKVRQTAIEDGKRGALGCGASAHSIPVATSVERAPAWQNSWVRAERAKKAHTTKMKSAEENAGLRPDADNPPPVPVFLTTTDPTPEGGGKEGGGIRNTVFTSNMRCQSLSGGSNTDKCSPRFQSSSGGSRQSLSGGSNTDKCNPSFQSSSGGSCQSPSGGSITYQSSLGCKSPSGGRDFDSIDSDDNKSQCVTPLWAEEALGTSYSTLSECANALSHMDRFEQLDQQLDEQLTRSEQLREERTDGCEHPRRDSSHIDSPNNTRIWHLNTVVEACQSLTERLCQYYEGGTQFITDYANVPQWNRPVSQNLPGFGTMSQAHRPVSQSPPELPELLQTQILRHYCPQVLVIWNHFAKIATRWDHQACATAERIHWHITGLKNSNVNNRGHTCRIIYSRCCQNLENIMSAPTLLGPQKPNDMVPTPPDLMVQSTVPGPVRERWSTYPVEKEYESQDLLHFIVSQWNSFAEFIKMSRTCCQKSPCQPPASKDHGPDEDYDGDDEEDDIHDNHHHDNGTSRNSNSLGYSDSGCQAPSGGSSTTGKTGNCSKLSGDSTIQSPISAPWIWYWPSTEEFMKLSDKFLTCMEHLHLRDVIAESTTYDQQSYWSNAYLDRTISDDSGLFGKYDQFCTNLKRERERGKIDLRGPAQPCLDDSDLNSNEFDYSHDLYGLQTALKTPSSRPTGRQLQNSIDICTADVQSAEVCASTKSYPSTSKPYISTVGHSAPVKSTHTIRKQSMYGWEIFAHIRGLPWPEMKDKNECEDGSMMGVLDSGAEVHVCLEKMFPNPGPNPLSLCSFNGVSSKCEVTGEVMCGSYSGSGEMVGMNLGFGGALKSHQMKNQLLSIPTMIQQGYQFWLGNFPYMLTPDIKEIPLYVNNKGFLGLRMHTANDSNIGNCVQSLHVTTPTAEIGYLANDELLWHRRMCHVNMNTLNHMDNNNLVHGMPKLRKYDSSKHQCISCELGKSCQAHVGEMNYSDKSKNAKIQRELDPTRVSYYPLEQIHVDTCYMEAPDIYGNTCFVAIVDRCTMMTWMIPLKSTKNMDKILGKFIDKVVTPFHKLRTHELLRRATLERTGKSATLENLANKVSGLRKVRCDRGSEFNNDKVRTMLLAHNYCILDPVPADVKDGRAESAVKKLCTYTRTCLIDAGLKKCFWGPIMDTIVHVMNRVFSRRAGGVPYTNLTGLLPNVSYFRQPGSVALFHRQNKRRQKLDERAYLGIFIGYDTAFKSWVFLNPKTGRKVRTVHARFYERSRDREEHIGMGSMIFDHKHWLRDKWHHNRCQLWPRILYPGMGEGKTGTDPGDYPDSVKLGDLLTSDQLDYNVSPDEIGKELAPTTQEPAPIDDRPCETETDDQTIRVQEHVDDYVDPPSDRKILPSDLIVKGPKYSTQKEGVNKERIAMVLGKQVRDVCGPNNLCPKFAIPTAGGGTRYYKPKDLKYDCTKTKTLKCVPFSEDVVDYEEEVAVSALSRACNGPFTKLARVRADNLLSHMGTELHLALADLQESPKELHWIWWVFPTERPGKSETIHKPGLSSSVHTCSALYVIENAPTLWRYTLEKCVELIKSDRWFRERNLSTIMFTNPHDLGRMGHFAEFWLHSDVRSFTPTWLINAARSIQDTLGSHHSVLSRTTVIGHSISHKGRHVSWKNCPEDTAECHKGKEWRTKSKSQSELSKSILEDKYPARKQQTDYGPLYPCSEVPTASSFGPENITKRIDRRTKPRHAIFFGKSVEVQHHFGEHKFDEEFSDGVTVKPTKQCTVGQATVSPAAWGQAPDDVPDIVSPIFIHNNGLSQETNLPESFVVDSHFPDNNKSDDSSCHYSVPIDYECKYGKMPCVEEFTSYRGNGTYVDSEGYIQPSYLVQNALSVWEDSYHTIKADGMRHVLGTPSPSELNDEESDATATLRGDSRVDVHVPKNSKQAMTNPKFYPMWPEAIYNELNGLMDMDCLEEFDRNDPRVLASHVLPSHIVFTDKWTADVPAEFIKAKARIVAGGNFEETPERAFENFSPTAGSVINRFFDAYCVYRGYTMYSTDCSQAFLNAPTKSGPGHDLFIFPPPGVGARGKVWRLKRYLYGLCAAPAAWMRTLTAALLKLGFSAFADDPCFLKRVDDEGDEIVIEIFVDDIKWGGKDPEKIKAVINELSNFGNPQPPHSFKITFEDKLTTYLGMLYEHDMTIEGKHTLTVNQTAYIETMIKRFEMEDDGEIKSGIHKTPLPTFSNVEELQDKMEKGLDKDLEWLKPWSKRHSFPTIIGSLIHAMVHTRPDIAYAVAILSRGMAKPELWMWRAAHYLLCYLKHTKHLGLVYKQEEMLRQATETAQSSSTEALNMLVTASLDEHETVMVNGSPVLLDSFIARHAANDKSPIYDKHLRASVDSSFADCIKSYRSTSGFVVWFGGSPIEWECKRQPLVTLSTMESEYVAASKCVCSIRFLHKLIQFVNLDRGTTKVHEDNASCVAISCKPVHRSRSKHIGAKYHNVREASTNGEVELVQVWTEHQTSDIFTKSLTTDKFERFRETLMGRVSFRDMQSNFPKPEKAAVSYAELDFREHAELAAETEADARLDDQRPECDIWQVIQDNAELTINYSTVVQPGWNAQYVPKHRSFGTTCAEWRSCMLGPAGAVLPGYSICGY